MNKYKMIQQLSRGEAVDFEGCKLLTVSGNNLKGGDILLCMKDNPQIMTCRTRDPFTRIIRVKENNHLYRTDECHKIIEIDGERV